MSIIRREKSRIGMYHVLMQGAGNNELFHDDEDYQVFVEYLAKLMKEAWAEDDEIGAFPPSLGRRNPPIRS